MRQDTEKQVARLNARIGSDCEVDHAACYGGYRLETKKGSSGFAYNSGTERRMTHKEFMIYLRGIHDLLDWQEMQG